MSEQRTQSTVHPLTNHIDAIERARRANYAVSQAEIEVIQRGLYTEEQFIKLFTTPKSKGTH